jgi:hypothetical protein
VAQVLKRVTYVWSLIVKGREIIMAPKYGEAAKESVARAIREEEQGKLKSGRSSVKVTSRTQAIAIGLSEARKHGAKVPPAPSRKH